MLMLLRLHVNVISIQKINPDNCLQYDNQNFHSLQKSLGFIRLAELALPQPRRRRPGSPPRCPAGRHQHGTSGLLPRRSRRSNRLRQA